MPGNHLEELVSEWYQFQGYFVRRNIQVGKRSQGGYTCELDIVAFNPKTKSLVHVEPSLDADSWEKREYRYQKKFDAGKQFIPALFDGLDLSETPIEQIALFVFAGGVRSTLGGGSVLLIKDFMLKVFRGVRARKIISSAIPEQYPLLRSLQFAAHYWPLLPEPIEKQESI